MTGGPSRQQSVFRNPNDLAGLNRVGDGLAQKSCGKCVVCQCPVARATYPLEFAFKVKFACSDFDPDVSVDLPFPRLGPHQKIQIRVTIWKICYQIAGAPTAQTNKALANRRAPGGHTERGRGASGDKANRPASDLTFTSSPAKD